MKRSWGGLRLKRVDIPFLVLDPFVLNLSLTVNGKVDAEFFSLFF